MRGARIAFAWLLVAGATTVVFAQAGGDKPAPAPAPAPEMLGNPAALSPADMVAQATEMQGKVQAAQGRVEQLAENARRSKDIVRLNCIQDKALQMKANTRVMTWATEALHRAIESKDEAMRLHEFTRLGLTRQKIEVLAVEAENCVGEETWSAGETQIKFDVDPTVPGGDPTEDIRPEPVIERPPVDSPFI
jgi:hypothetical protein